MYSKIFGNLLLIFSFLFFLHIIPYPRVLKRGYVWKTTPTLYLHAYNITYSESGFCRNHISKFRNRWFIIPFGFIIGYNTKLSCARTKRDPILYIFSLALALVLRFTSFFIFFHSDLFIRWVQPERFIWNRYIIIILLQFIDIDAVEYYYYYVPFWERTFWSGHYRQKCL